MKSRFETGFMNGMTATDLVIHKMYSADIDILCHRNANILLESGADMIFAVKEMIRNSGQRNILCVVVVDVL